MSFEDSSFEDDQSEEQESSVVRQMRDQLKKLEKDLQKERKDKQELTQFREQHQQELRQSKAVATFKELGLPEGLVKVLPTDLDLEPGSIAEWAAELGLGKNEEKEPQPEASAETVPDKPQSTYFTPSVQGSDVPQTQNKMTTKEWRQLYNQNPGAAAKAMQDGKVETPMSDYYHRVG